LKELILKGVIKPNQKIIEKDLTALFEVSNTPVREAIKKLAWEGLITMSSHKEAVVKEISYKELMDIYYVMICNDEMGIRLLYKKNPDVLSEVITDYLNRMKKVAAKETVEDYLALNEEMHMKICELGENEFLCHVRHLINSQLGRYRPLRFFLFTRSDAIKKSLDEDTALLNAVKNKDKRKIERLTRGRWVEFLSSEEEWLEHIEMKGKKVGKPT
jgi:DNA-binding GntR family transcriptional regulator